MDYQIPLINFSKLRCGELIEGIFAVKNTTVKIILCSCFPSFHVFKLVGFNLINADAESFQF